MNLRGEFNFFSTVLTSIFNMAGSQDQIDVNKPRRSYLIAYSQANLNKFPARESFGTAVTEAFTSEQSQTTTLGIFSREAF